MNFAARFLMCWCLVSSSLASDLWEVRFDGVGPVKIGMTLAQLNIVLSEKFRKPADKSSQACFYVKPHKHPHIAFMIEDGRLARMDVDSSGIFTSSRIQVGDTETRVRDVYGARVKTETHHYNPDGQYLTVLSSDGKYGIRFETDGKAIVGPFYAGRYEAIQYVEGCL